MPLEVGPSNFVGKQQYISADLELLRRMVSCNTMSDTSKIEIMEQAVAPCPHLMMDVKGKTFKALLDSGSQVTIVKESFFKENLADLIPPMSRDKINAHNLFTLKGVEGGKVPLSKYFEGDVTVGGFTMYQVGFWYKRILSLQ